ncbi:hypothetical protein OROHE_000813 [Orobanche hederae]
MAKKQVPAERSPTHENSKTPKKNKIKSRTSTTIDAKNKNKSRNKVSKTVADLAFSEENEVLVAPSSSTEFENDGAVESSKTVKDRADERSLIDKVVTAEKKKPKSNKHSIKRKSEKEESANMRKKRSKKEDEIESDVEEKSDNARYRFPMNRVSRIIKSSNPDVKISQEAVFLINRASEKFLEVFSSEAYACSFLEGKTFTAYNHLSSVVAKQKQFNFLSDFVPEKVKAEDALAEVPEAELMIIQ